MTATASQLNTFASSSQGRSRSVRYVFVPRFIGAARTEAKTAREKRIKERMRWFLSWGAYGAPASEPEHDHIEGATKWEVYSKRNYNRLCRAFDHQNVPSVLYERTGTIVDTGRKTGKGYYIFHMQLVRFGGKQDWDLDFSLTEAGLFVQEQID